MKWEPTNQQKNQNDKTRIEVFSFHVDCVLLLSSHITNLDFQMFMHFLQKPRFSVQDFPKRKQLPWTALSRDWIFDSSSEVWEEEEGSTSLTPESAGLGGREPGVIMSAIIRVFKKFYFLLLRFVLPGGRRECIIFSVDCLQHIRIVPHMSDQNWVGRCLGGKTIKFSRSYFCFAWF